jgi:hypothetical protein
MCSSSERLLIRPLRLHGLAGLLLGYVMLSVGTEVPGVASHRDVLIWAGAMELDIEIFFAHDVKVVENVALPKIVALELRGKAHRVLQEKKPLRPKRGRELVKLQKGQSLYKSVFHSIHQIKNHSKAR